MIIRDALTLGEKRLSASGIENSRMEALWLLCPHIGFTQKPLDLYLFGDQAIPATVANQYQSALAKRSLRVPMAYILGSQDFFGLKFMVNPNVLIPRQETEILVEETIKQMRKITAPSILDIGTGSGNIAIALAKNCPTAKIVATDISMAALQVARKNAVINGVEAQITFLQSDLLHPLISHPSSLIPFKMIVSNPPYIKTHELRKLQKEIQMEPLSALAGGKDGLKFVRRIINQSRRRLKKNGYLILEVGYDQSRKARELMERAGFSNVRTVKDFSGIERVVLGKTD